MQNPRMSHVYVILALILTTLTGIARTGAAQTGTATDEFQWPAGKRCAVSLTFDDARESQMDHGTALLNKYGVKATFYVLPSRVKNRLEQWKQTAKDGHEIGNHSMSHPCSGNFSFTRKNALEEHTPEMIEKELLDCNAALRDLIGVTPVSFAFPCGQTFIGRGRNLQSYIPIVATHFLTGRGYMNESSNNPAFCDLANLMGIKSDGLSFRSMKRLVDETAKAGFWLVLAGHEMSPDRGTTTGELEQLLVYMTDPANGIWAAPVREIAEYIVKTRKP